jgi:hypothetical protein
MKSSISSLAAAAALPFFAASSGFTADAPSTDAATSGPQAVAQAPVTPSTPAPNAASSASVVTKVPYGVDDVLKLSHAKVSEDIILSYIRSSGTVYNLSPSDLVYLKNQGVSDRVVNAMLDQRNVASSQTVPAPQLASAAPATPDANATATTPVQQAPVYVVPATDASASSVYVIPYQPTYPYYGYYGYPYPVYYGGYYGGYCGPVVTFGFGYGGHYGCYGGHYYGYGGHGYVAHGFGHGGHFGGHH